MNEKKLQGQLVSTARQMIPQFVWIRHEDRLSDGIPDMSATGRAMTSWWELKYADPTFDSQGIQELTLKRLAHQGYARYIIYTEHESDRDRSVQIIHPNDLHGWTPESAILQNGLWTTGFDHEWVVKQIWEAHSAIRR